jgi:hypothetical protein
VVKTGLNVVEPRNGRNNTQSTYQGIPGIIPYHLTARPLFLSFLSLCRPFAFLDREDRQYVARCKSYVSCLPRSFDVIIGAENAGGGIRVDDIEDDSLRSATLKLRHHPDSLSTRFSLVNIVPEEKALALITGNPAELLSLHRGQGLEILWRDSLQCPSEEEYIMMANNSTFIPRPNHDNIL